MVHWERIQGLRGCILDSSLSSTPARPSDLLMSQLLFLSWPLRSPIRGQEPTCSEHQCVPGLRLSLHSFLWYHPSDPLGAVLGVSPHADEDADSGVRAHAGLMVGETLGLEPFLPGCKTHFLSPRLPLPPLPWVHTCFLRPKGT